jgi:hypothetical protein
MALEIAQGNLLKDPKPAMQLWMAPAYTETEHVSLCETKY